LTRRCFFQLAVVEEVDVGWKKSCKEAP